MARMSGMFLIVLFFIALVSFEILKKEQIAGSGHVIAKTIDIETFDGITLEGIGNVQMKQGDVVAVLNEAAKEAMNRRDLARFF